VLKGFHAYFLANVSAVIQASTGCGVVDFSYADHLTLRYN
jgi:hypothetical protein